MGISRRMGVTVAGLAFAGATMATLGTAGSASAQTATIAAPQSIATYGGGGGYAHRRSLVRKHLRTGNFSYSYYKRTSDTSWYYWYGGCGGCGWF
ncbi:hypothetical protein [Actinoallomurus soli]|uniref:hypothetical protein n=1 Tax=Actinoallomurus soli TaxID=2952535 RepID=UPI002093D689|nr:hypothetical protein [Actinoallomurus soli]MCO5968392.1 hypothetical protein [Actinoallomurus soli]